ncbi:double zinc ribbon domain-containing protein [Streptoverticillium reticulum]|uniref:double zinc ribbon domain-containing protein n=1 Tax=Streptoverticillium reticulum TaxID=1433415 RepID=UPI0039BF25D2
MSGTEIYFAGNYHDMSQQYGTASGFQFEFYCSRCHDTWRSPFEPYRGGRLAGWLSKGVGAASGLLGSVVSEVSTAADGLAGSSWGKSRDAAFQRAITGAEGHFNRCARCASYVCGRCWNAEQGLCLHCAPDTAGEMMAAQQRGLNDLVSQRAYDEGQRRGQEYDAQTPRQLVCPQCRTETQGGRFCMGCGHELAQQPSCAGCRTPLPDGAAFCPGCGQRR